MECMLNRQIIQESGGGGDTSETWVLNEQVNVLTKFSYTINFTSNNTQFNSISVGGKPTPTATGPTYDLIYGTETIITGANSGLFGFEGTGSRQIYRKLTFTTAPTGELLTWLQANGVKQEKNLAVQPSKSLTITSNGTTTITPDVPYDAMEQVGVTVNVPKIDYNTIASTWEKHDFDFNDTEDAEISATGTATGLFAVLSEYDTTSFIVFTTGNTSASTAPQLAICNGLWSFNAIDNGVSIMTAGADVLTVFYATPYIYIQTT